MNVKNNIIGRKGTLIEQSASLARNESETVGLRGSLRKQGVDDWMIDVAEAILKGVEQYHADYQRFDVVPDVAIQIAKAYRKSDDYKALLRMCALAAKL